jgi:hypothetical protein
MKTAIRAVLSPFLALFFAGTANSTTPPTPGHRVASPDNSVTLIRLLRIDEMLSELSRSQAMESFKAGRITKPQLACLKTTTAADFTQGLAAVVRKELTVDETSKAVAYLNSRDGRVFSEMLSLDRTTPTLRDPTPSELDGFTAFRNSPAGKKLDETAMLMRTDGVSEVIASYAKRVKEKCHLTQPLIAPDEKG